MKTEEKLALNKYVQHPEAHIVLLDQASCDACSATTCVYVCPAECFVVRNDHVTFSHDGCLECGSCRVACPQGALRWGYPEAGFGICYQFG